MKPQKSIGIWMDHANAYYTELSNGEMLTHNIASTFTHEQKTSTLKHGEFTMHNKEQQWQAAFYAKLEEIILPYSNVVLFGPTDAKVELFNLLKANSKFDKIFIEYANADKMNEANQQKFIKNYFNKN